MILSFILVLFFIKFILNCLKIVYNVNRELIRTLFDFHQKIYDRLKSNSNLV